MPDFVPLEDGSSSQSNNYHPRNVQFRSKSPIQHSSNYNNYNYNSNNQRAVSNKPKNFNKKNQNQSTEDHHANSKGGVEKFNGQQRKRKPSPIVPPPKVEEIQPTNRTIKINGDARNKCTPKQPVFQRLGNNSCSAQRHSPIVFDLNQKIRSNSTSSSLLGNTSQVSDLQNINVMVQTDDVFDDLPSLTQIPRISTNLAEEQIIERIKSIETNQKNLVGHACGLRDTLDQYYREISKLEILISQNAQELEILKRRIFK